jgi:anti-anti-sigma factor
LRIKEETVGPDYVVLSMQGEFDTPYVQEFSDRIESSIAAGKPRIILNLRFLRLINSTALGSIVRLQKKLRQHGGDLVISHPSPFCRDVIEKVGLDKLIEIFDDDSEAVSHYIEVAPRPRASVEQASDVLFSYVDAAKKDVAPRPTEIGRIRFWEEEALIFDWNASNTNLTNELLKKLFEPGTELRLKFKLPLSKKSDFIEVQARVETAELPKKGLGVRVRARFTKIDDAARKAVSQFVQDMRFLKNELEKAKTTEA